jgi:hypothetical protein
MSDDYQLQRSISDIQSRIANLDHSLMRMSAGAPAEARPGRLFFAQAMASLLRLRGDYERAEKIEQKAATNPAMTTVPTWAAELTASSVGGLLLAIVKQSAYAAVAVRTQAFAIDGPSLPKVIVGGDIAAGFVAENMPIPVSKGSLSPLALTPKKLTALTTFSEELLNFGINTQATLTQLMSNGVASALDAVFFGNAAATTAAPAGILNGISATTASTTTPSSEAAREDLRALVGALSAATDPVFVAAPARALYLQSVLGTSGIPVFASGALSANRVVCVDAGALIAAHSTQPRFSTSNEATLHEDDSPTALSAVGTPNTVAAPARSLFQTNVVALRAILYVAWALRTGGVSYLDATAW